MSDPTQSSPSSASSEDSIALMDIFRNLARDLGAEDAWPDEEGILSFFFRGEARLRDGYTLLSFANPEQTGILDWHPTKTPNHVVVEELDGGFTGFNLQPQQTKTLVERLARVADHHSFDTIHPFGRIGSPGQSTKIELSDRFVQKTLGAFLREGITRWGPFLLQPVVHLAQGAVLLRFEAPEEAKTEPPAEVPSTTPPVEIPPTTPPVEIPPTTPPTPAEHRLVRLPEGTTLEGFTPGRNYLLMGEPPASDQVITDAGHFQDFVPGAFVEVDDDALEIPRWPPPSLLIQRSRSPGTGSIGETPPS